MSHQLGGRAVSALLVGGGVDSYSRGMARVGGRPVPTIAQLAQAVRRLETETGDPFYRVATELVELANQRKTKIKVSEALAVLLLTWNMSYFRFHPERRPRLVGDLDDQLARHKRALARFRSTCIESFSADNEGAARTVFESFDGVLGAVGTAKALHLLAPRFFPLWDTKIANAYELRGHGADRYLSFINLVKRQCEVLGGIGAIERAVGCNALRALDTFNYRRYTLGK
jgi:hypothetical protein